MWSQVDPDRIVESWAQQVPELTAVVSGAQMGAARLADGYTDESLASQDLDTDSAAAVNPPAFTGASDGRGLVGLLTNPAVITVLTIADIADVTRALSVGRAHLDTIVRTQVSDAGRLADQASLVAHQSATGYVRVTDGNPCARCLILAGKTYRWNQGFLRHPRCGCTHIPTLVAHPRWKSLDPRALYDSMTPAQRSRAGFTLADQEAIDLGADLNQVVNARHRPGALYTAGGRRFTREGTTRRGLFGGFDIGPDGSLIRRPPGAGIPPRLTPDQIFREATSREQAIAGLIENRYLIADAPRALVPRPAVAVDRLAVRAELAAARTVDDVSRALEREYTRITGRQLDVTLSGSVATARDHAEGLLRGAERFPSAPLRRVTTGPTQGFYGLSNRSHVIFSDEWSAVAARRDYLAAVQADMRSRWHPPRTSSPASVAMHEFAHSIPFDRAAMSRLIGTRADEISRYAARDLDEAVAEAVTDVLVNGERAALLSRQVVDLLDRGPTPLTARRLEIEDTFTARRALIERDFTARRAQLEARSAAREEFRQARTAERAALRQLRADERAARRALREQAFAERRAVLLPSGPDPGPIGPAGPARPVRRVLLDAATPGDVSRVLSDEYRRITGREMRADLRGSVETAREHAEGLLQAVERYPDLRIDVVRTGPQSSYAKTYAAQREIVFGQGLSSVARRDEYLGALATDARTRWHPAGTTSAVSSALHEAGHLLDLTTLGRGIRRDLDLLLARRAGPDAVEDLVQREISDYALTDLDELVAEAFEDVMTNGLAAGQLSREVVDLLDDAYRATRRPGLRGAARALPSAPDPARLSLPALKRRVTDAGITVPTGLRKPALVRLVDDLDAGMPPAAARARAVQSIVDERRAVAEVLADVDQALAEQASARALAHMARRVDALEPALKPQALAAALRAGDVDAARAASAKLATTAKLKPAGTTGAVARFDRATMDFAGTSRGDVVSVVRPGFTTTMERKTLTLSRATVQPATPAQVAALRAPVKAVKKAAPAKKAAAPKAPPAPEKLSIPALKTELSKAIDLDLAGVPKPVLARWVRTVRDPGSSSLTEHAARFRQEIIDKRRTLAEALTEVDELLGNGASAATLTARGAARMRRVEAALVDWPELVELRKVVTAMGTGDPRKIRAAVKAAQRKTGLSQVGPDAGSTARMTGDMTPLGGAKIPDGAPVTVVRPGYTVQIGSERVVLSRPVVELVPEAPRIDRTATPARVLEQEKAARDAALAAPPVKLEGLRGADAKALFYYQRHGDVHMNGVLRKGRVKAHEGAKPGTVPDIAQVRASIADIDALMARSELGEGVVVYRGMGSVRKIFRDSDQPGSLVGRTFTDKGFVSTSADRGTAMDFMAGDEFVDMGVLMEVRVPPGTRAIQVSNDGYKGRSPSVGSEREILLDRGLRYRIVSDEIRDHVHQFGSTAETGRPYRHVVVEVIS